MPQVSIIIVSWNNTKYLSNCLSRLSLQVFQNFEIIIIDNGSKNREDIVNSIKIHNQVDLQVKYLSSNLGFSAANNIASRLARGKWIALLNADAYPEPDWLESLIQTAESHPEYSSFSSRQIQEKNPDLLDGAGDAYHISGLAWRNGYQLPAKIHSLEKIEVFSACGAAALFRRNDFINIGGFDEDFFSYFEDVDLGFRLRLQGKKCLYVPDAVVYHVGSASTGKRSDFSVYYGYRNMIWTFFKNMPSPLIWYLLPVHVFTLVFFILYLSLRGQGKAILNAIIDAIKGLKRVLKQRKIIQANIKIDSSELLNAMSTGWFEPYLEFKRRNAK